MVISPPPIARAIQSLERYGLFLVLGILLVMPFISEQLGYNPLSLFFQTMISKVITLVDPLMKLHCISIQSQACGNLHP